MSRRSGYIRIDIADYIDEIEDEVIEEEFRERKLNLKLPNEPDSKDVLRDAYEELLRNRPAEARAILERVLYPKFNSPERCAEAYAKAEGKS